MFKRILVIVNPKKESASHLIEKLKNWSAEHGLEVIIQKAFEEINPAFREAREKESTLAITLGGDGTFLKGAQLLAPYDIPILGVNLGSLGFLTQTRSPDLLSALEKVLKSDFIVENRMRLECYCNNSSDSGNFTALNELLISRRGIEGFIEVELFAESFISCYPGDGLIFSTSTGSTAYSLAAGGPIVNPQMECIIVTPLGAHRLGVRPLIFPPDKKLRAFSHDDAVIIADGDIVTELPAGEEVLIKRSKFTTKLIVVEPKPDLFSILETKLNWDRNSRRKLS
jgi:NAD+ kinase